MSFTPARATFKGMGSQRLVRITCALDEGFAQEQREAGVAVAGETLFMPGTTGLLSASISAFRGAVVRLFGARLVIELVAILALKVVLCWRCLALAWLNATLQDSTPEARHIPL